MFVLNGNSQKVLEAFRSLGLGEYASRVYFTLAVCGELRAWDAAKLSGVSFGRIYFVLDGLAERGLVAVAEGRPKKYSAKPLHAAVRSLVAKRRTELMRAENGGRWLVAVRKSIAPLAKKHMGRIRIFEPSYRRARGSLLRNFGKPV